MDSYLKKTLLAVALTASAFGLAAQSASAITLWNENVNGDLSDEGLHPTSVGSLNLGSNLLTANFNAGTDNPAPDYFTFTVPHGLALNGIELKSWNSSPVFEDIAFIAVQRGSIFDYEVPEDRGSAAGLLGWSHLRSTQVNTNKIFQEISTSNLDHVTSGTAAFYEEEAASNPYDGLALAPGDTPELLEDNLRGLTEQWAPGAEGFKAPLPAGDYTFWLRQGSDVDISAQLDFNTVVSSNADEVPEPLSIFGTGLALGFGYVFRRKKQQRQVS
ncbi:PEP-CTERM sorting domain-containing protein [Acaryochloris sp. IP29b_bin.148]|uniref:PEP-CTERM sorting domain-containing protein n=1 Tax=Acaryochloris sp. IP29b_bin.148 TaxID=2969218 RepID=UPI0026289639|nr:PEP-CTERM sorting domain-containing protein [Acaryochloris sp. IP29b_bin.148]